MTLNEIERTLNVTKILYECLLVVVLLTRVLHVVQFYKILNSRSLTIRPVEHVNTKTLEVLLFLRPTV